MIQLFQTPSTSSENNGHILEQFYIHFNLKITVWIILDALPGSPLTETGVCVHIAGTDGSHHLCLPFFNMQKHREQKLVSIFAVTVCGIKDD